MRAGAIAPVEMEPHDAHVVHASKIFRGCGFDLTAMQYPRPADAIAALRRFNRVPEHIVEPFGWRYFPNAYMRDNWRNYYS